MSGLLAWTVEKIEGPTSKIGAAGRLGLGPLS